MEYVGIVCATVLMRISCATFEINFSFHPNTLFVIFSWSSLKVPTFDFPLGIGRPKCFSHSDIIRAPNICWMSFLTSHLVFLLKNNVVFCLFIAWPDAASYLPNRSSNLWHSPTVAWQNNKVSLANKRWEIRTPYWLDNTPLSAQLSLAFLNKADNPSTHKRYKYGESGTTKKWF